MVSRGEYLHFRCGQHAVEGAFAESQAVYRCDIRGCERPAKAYWYRGEKFQTLPAKFVIEISYDDVTLP